MIFIGIDIGMDGGFFAINETGKVLDSAIMPTVKTGKGRDLDREAIQSFLELGDIIGDPVKITIEEAPHHAPSAKALRSLAYGFGLIEGILWWRREKNPYSIVRAIDWQREFWKRPKMPKGKKFNTKAEALKHAKMLWPEQTWLKSDRSKKPHDGLIDAALIAEWTRRQWVKT